MRMFDAKQSLLFYIAKDHVTQTRLVQIFSLGSLSFKRTFLRVRSGAESSLKLWSEEELISILGPSQSILLYILLGKKASFLEAYSSLWILLLSSPFSLHFMCWFIYGVVFLSRRTQSNKISWISPNFLCQWKVNLISWWVQPMTSTSSRTSVSTLPLSLPPAFIGSPGVQYHLAGFPLILWSKCLTFSCVLFSLSTFLFTCIQSHHFQILAFPDLYMKAVKFLETPMVTKSKSTTVWEHMSAELCWRQGCSLHILAFNCLCFSLCFRDLESWGLKSSSFSKSLEVLGIAIDFFLVYSPFSSPWLWDLGFWLS